MMEPEVKREIKLMFIPLIGIWWVINRILPDLGPVTWWDYSGRGLLVIYGMCIYQATCFGLLKVVTTLLI